MSLMSDSTCTAPLRFPRVSGDEPLVQLPSDSHTRFSPRERG